MSTDGSIVLSVIVTTIGGAHFLEECLETLVPQIGNRSIEIIVPHESSFSSITELAQKFPKVVFLEIEKFPADAAGNSFSANHELYDRYKSVGLQAGKGRILALLDDQGVPASDWCDQVIKAHELPHGVIGGAIEHRGSGALNWAVYFQDFGRYQLPLSEGPTGYLSDINISYKRAAIEAVKGLWQDRYNEVVVNWGLSRQGVVLWQRPKMVVFLDRGNLRFFELLQERYHWGRLFGYVRTKEASFLSRVTYMALSPLIPFVLVGRMTCKVMVSRRNRREFFRSAGAIIALTCAWALGEVVGYVTKQESAP